MVIMSPILRRSGIAFFARQFVADHGLTTFRRGDPWTIRPGRVIAHMLVVAAGKLCNPVTVFVLMKSGNRALHGIKIRVAASAQNSMPKLIE
jgi:hypothetical protein